MMPQGHAGVYLADFCADGPVHLRPCNPGEPGVVLSRYHDLRHPALDWLDEPLIPFLYGVDDAASVPASMDARLRAVLRERYRQTYLREIVPDRTDPYPTVRGLGGRDRGGVRPARAAVYL